MATITAPGISTGLDINSLVSQLVAATRQPTADRLDLKEAKYQAELSGYGLLKSALSSFRDTISSFSRLSTFQTATANSSDTAILTAKAGLTAVAGSYDIKVDKLAQSHTLATGGFADLNTVVGTGTLTFKFGTTDYDPGVDPDPETYTSFTANADKAAKTVTIDASNNTLQGMKDAINKADIGVSAAIIYDGASYRLTLTSKDTGAANSMEITVDDSGDGDSLNNSGLSQMAFNAGATNVTQTSVAQDASLSVNGLQVTSATNSLSSTISGLTLSLVSADPSKTIKIDVTKNSNVVDSSVRSFVAAYNDVMATINSLSDYDAATGVAGILTGDPALNGIARQLRNVLNESMAGLTGPFAGLADIGIRTERDGTLAIDDTKLAAALTKDADAVAYLFAKGGKTSSSALTYLSATADTLPGTYPVNITQAATQGRIIGSTFGYTGAINISAGNNDTLSLNVAGIASGTITLTAGTYTSESLAAELQTRINGDTTLSAAGQAVQVAFDSVNNTFSITSAKYGSAANVNILTVGSGVSSSFGLAVGNGTAGLDVIGTLGGYAATGVGQELTGTGLAKGLKVQVTGTDIGAYGTVSFTRGVAERYSPLLSNFLATTGSIATRTDGVNTRIEDIEDQRVTLDARMAALEARYFVQFNAMDALVAQLNTTSNFLTTQLDNLPGFTFNKN